MTAVSLTLSDTSDKKQNSDIHISEHACRYPIPEAEHPSLEYKIENSIAVCHTITYILGNMNFAREQNNSSQPIRYTLMSYDQFLLIVGLEPWSPISSMLSKVRTCDFLRIRQSLLVVISLVLLITGLFCILHVPG